MKDALATLGTILDEDAGRDAIHLAVEPAIAGETLFPAQRVAVLNGKAYRAITGSVGIVDPFLEEAVHRGTRFWLVVYPRTITSLRHVWTHPALDDEPASQSPRQSSELWLRRFLDENEYMFADYEEVVAAAIRHAAQDDDSPYLQLSTDARGEIPPEFWDHLEAVTGIKAPANRRAIWFSCSC